MAYVSYIRISKESKSGKAEGRHLGLEAQQAIIGHYYPSLEAEYVEIKSAKDISHRSELQKAIAYCKEHKHTLVVAKVDRLSRVVEDCLHVWKELGHRIRFCDIPGTVDKFTLTMYAAFAERERELISLRTSQAIQAKIARGESWSTGNPSYTNGSVGAIGRKISMHNAATNPSTLQVADIIKDKMNLGMSRKSITKHLNQLGHTTVRGKSWSLTQVSRVIKRFT